MQSVQEMARTIKEAVEIAANCRILPEHAIITWIVEHSSTLLNLFKRSNGGDGMTAYFNLRGRQWKIPFPPIGECVEYQRNTNTKLQNNFTPGAFLGMRVTSAEKIACDIETSEIHFVQTVHRKPKPDRRNAVAILSINKTPWNYKPREDEDTDPPMPVSIQELDRPYHPKKKTQAVDDKVNKVSMSTPSTCYL